MKKLIVLSLVAMLAITACGGQAAPTPNVQQTVEAALAAQPPVVRVVTATPLPPTSTPMPTIAPTADVQKTVDAAVAAALAKVTPTAFAPAATLTPVVCVATKALPIALPPTGGCAGAISGNMTGADVNVFIAGLPKDKATYFQNDVVANPGFRGEITATSNYGSLEGLPRTHWEHSNPGAGVSMIYVPAGCVEVGDELGGGGHKVTLGVGLHNLQAISRPPLPYDGPKGECDGTLAHCYSDHVVWAVIKQ